MSARRVHAFRAFSAARAGSCRFVELLLPVMDSVPLASTRRKRCAFFDHRELSEPFRKDESESL